MSVYKKEDLGLRTEVIYRLFLTFWDANIILFSLFSHFKTNKNKTILNQQYDVMITSIGENGSHVPCASRLLHHTIYLFPLFWRRGIKQKKHDFICRCFWFSLLLLRINLESLFNWNCITLQVSFNGSSYYIGYSYLQLAYTNSLAIKQRKQYQNRQWRTQGTTLK